MIQAQQLLTALFLTISTVAEGQWTLIYHNNDSGKKLSGQIENLFDAVRGGKEVRIYWSGQHPTDPKIKVEHLAHAKFLTIMSDSTVMAQIDPIVGQIPDFDNQKITLKENLEWPFIASTNGQCDTMTRNMISGEVIEHSIRPMEVKWFVRKDE